MKNLIFPALGLGLASLCAQANSEAPSVDVFGVTKNARYHQTAGGVVSYDTSGIYAFVQGTGISSAFPSQPVAMVVPGGTSYALGLEDGIFGSQSWSRRSLWYEASFANEAALNTLFPDGNYIFTSGVHSYQLDLVGSYVAAPLVQFSAGHWEGGRLVLTAEQAAADWQIISSFTDANGFRSIAVNDDAFSFDYYIYEDGQGGRFPGTVSAVISGGSLRPGLTYNVEVEFDNVVDYINPTVGELRNGFALYSTTTFLIVSVVPEPQVWQFFAAGLVPLVWGFRRANSSGLSSSRIRTRDA